MAISVPFGRGAFAQTGNKKKRNIVLILIDDQRYDAMSALGHPFLETPALDRMMAEGAYLKYAFVTTSLCSPSRASILSSQYAHRHGVLDNRTPLPADTPTFPALLQQNGYETAFVGKWHMGGASDAPRPGFDHWVSFRGQGTYYDPVFNINGARATEEGYVTDLITDHSVRWLKRSHEKPFFLYMSHKAVHAMFEPARRHRKKYSEVKIPHPPSMADTDENYRGKPGWVRRQRNSWHGVDGMYDGQIDFEIFVRNYNRTMLAVDESIGTLFETLRELGRDRDTLVIFTSDNGFQFGEHGLIDKRTMYEESMRVPMLVRCPEIIPAGRTLEQLALNIDIGPTILDTAGAAIPPTMQGRSFLPLVEGQSTAWRDAILYEYFWERAYPQTPTVIGVRTNRWKYMNYHGMWSLNELYDLENDPQEMNNLIARTNTGRDYTVDPAHEGILKQLQQKLRELAEQSGIRNNPRWRV